MKYMVTKNNPSYPSVEYFEYIDDAIAQRDEWIKEMASDDGRHECKVTIAEVIETKLVHSDY